MTGAALMFGRHATSIWLERLVAVAIALISLSLLFANLQYGSNEKLSPAVELLSAEIQSPTVLSGGDLEIMYFFEKKRDDCHNGRIQRHVWNSDGVWIMVADAEQAKQAPAKPHPQSIKLKIPLVSMTSGESIPAGVWSLNTRVSYDCPYNGEAIVLDDTIDSPPFEVVN